MNPVKKLLLAYIKHHPARLALTILAVMASSCMVVWVVSGYDELLKQFKEFSGVSLGRYSLMVYPSRSASRTATPNAQQPAIPPEIIEQLKHDPDVQSIDAMWGNPARVSLYNPDTFGAAPPTRPSSQPASRPVPTTTNQGGPKGRGGILLIGTDAPSPPFLNMKAGHWIDPTKSDALVGVLSADAAFRADAKLGDTISAGVGENAQKILVVGIMDSPPVPDGARNLRGPAGGGLFVAMPLAAKIFNKPLQYNSIGLVLKPGVDVNKFRFSWQPRLNAASTPLIFQNAQELEEELDSSQTARNMLMQAYAATAISLLAALFIIFATLSMGVSERARQFAILRAVSLNRSQIAKLIALESLLMAIIGWAGGILSGFALLWIVKQAHPGLDEDAVEVANAGGGLFGKWSLLLSATCAFGGALLASILPAFSAMRLQPLDALAPHSSKHPNRLPLYTTITGLFLIALNPLLTYVIPLADESRYALYMAVGCVSMAMGFILLAPAAVILCDKLLSPILCAILGIERCLLKSQLSSNLWRSVGTAVALTIGLGLYVSMQVWGYTMLRPFEPGQWNPDVMIAFLPDGLPPSANDAVAHLPGLNPDSCLPLAIEQPKLTDDITHSEERASVVRQDNIILIGLDPDRALGSKNPLLKFDWVQGNPQSAIELLKKGRHCIVPDHFCRESGLKLGDSFRLNPQSDNSAPISYTIAGVVRLPGWHWMSKFSGVRLNSARSAAMTFAAYDSVAADFNITNVRFYWANAQVAPTTPPAGSASSNITPLNTETLSAASLQLAQQHTGLTFQKAGAGFPQNDPGQTLRITTPQDITQRIRQRADTWIWSMSQLPLVTLAVTSLGVLNAIMASIRARRWELGVMRSIGFTRSALARMILAESLLIGLVACLLSLSFGILAGWCGAGISQYVSFFGGLHPGLVIPWLKLSLGISAALSLCLLAALIPALQATRVEPLKLLQQGRSAL